MKRVLKSHWIIVNYARNAILGGTFETYEAALAELRNQLGRHEYKNPGWVIEEREAFVDVKEIVKEDEW